MLWRLNLPLDALDDVADRVLDEQAIASVDALIARRIDTRLPAAYLTGEAWLQGVPFTIDERSIVPRSLIAEVLADGTSTPGCRACPRACSICAPATAASPCWLRCAGRLRGSTRRTCRPMR